MNTRNIFAGLLILSFETSAFELGLNINQFEASSFDAAGRAFTSDLGANSIRVGYNHGDHNFGVQWAAQNGKGVLFFLGYSVGCNVKTASGRQCYADRSAALARAYGDKVQWYEVWNEWNGGLGFGMQCNTDPVCVDHAMYADLLCRTYKAIKAVRPTAKVVGGATSSTDIKWVTGVMQNGAGKCMDAWSTHPYVFLPGATFRVPTGATASQGVDKVIEAHNALQAVFMQKAGRNFPVLITEEGRRSYANDPGSETRQAQYLIELIKRAPSMPFLQGIWWYALEDSQDPHGFGLLRRSNFKKPSYFAFKAVVTGGPVVTPPPPVPVDLTVSADGTSIPNTHIVDNDKRVWRVIGGMPSINGAAVPGSSINLLLKHAGVIYQRNTAGNWWKWINGAWVATQDPRQPTS